MILGDAGKMAMLISDIKEKPLCVAPPIKALQFDFAARLGFWIAQDRSLAPEE